MMKMIFSPCLLTNIEPMLEDIAQRTNTTKNQVFKNMVAEGKEPLTAKNITTIFANTITKNVALGDDHDQYCCWLVESMPKHDRPLGDCLLNAIKEERLTGNPVKFGYTIDARGSSGRGVIQLILHAFNYNKKTKTFYDTTQINHPLLAVVLEGSPLEAFGIRGSSGLDDYFILTQSNRAFSYRSQGRPTEPKDFTYAYESQFDLDFPIKAIAEMD